ncbi:HAD family phosphatase [Mobilitalea sibirica]|uniref:HAD family phosphatase n=1 Tax=Mobilitalea sibirica TaxID=1462919 RepID=A0A8J7H1W9_9FIRM|nr:HAD family phosphatase [Mobilitalea sibirica]MBH1940589.1 HAD family phosphatase [Mobilitalea sibirica]
MINTIVFDIGNVLAHFGWLEYLKECGYDDVTIDKIGKATVYHRLWKELDRSLNMEQELIDQFIANDPEVASEIAEFLDKSYQVVWEYEGSVELIQDLKKKGYKVYLLSNYGGRNFQHAKENFEFFQHVDGAVISYEVGYVKPEPAIFQALIDKYNIIPQEAVFLDDTKVNVEAAKVLGFQTIHVTSHQEIRNELKKFHIIV